MPVMHTMAAFLRAVNVGGRTVRMAELRDIFRAAGVADPRTLLASGNVVFRSPEPPSALRPRLESALRAALGYEVTVLLRTAADLETISARTPFPPALALRAVASNVILLERPLHPEEHPLIDAFAQPPDHFALHGDTLYWLCEVKQSESAFTNARLERATGVRSTIRTARTVERVLAAAAELR